MTYDGAAINANWENAWPADASNPEDPGHEFSPVLQAPVANLLGAPWVLEAGSPGGDYVTWLYDTPEQPIAEGIAQVGVNVMVTSEGVRWVLESSDDMGTPIETAIGAKADAAPEDVVAWVKAWCAERGYKIPFVDPLSPCVDCGEPVPTVHTGEGWRGATCPKSTSVHFPGHRVDRAAFDAAVAAKQAAEA